MQWYARMDSVFLFDVKAAVTTRHEKSPSVDLQSIGVKHLCRVSRVPTLYTFGRDLLYFFCDLPISKLQEEFSVEGLFLELKFILLQNSNEQFEIKNVQSNL